MGDAARSSVVVFAGPTLAGVELPCGLAAETRAPARMGDVYALVGTGVCTIVLIDGVFHREPSVWQREILAALDAGVRVVGAGQHGRAARVEALITEAGKPEGALPHLLLLTPLLKHHQRLGESLVIDGDPVDLLWPVPISEAELALEKTDGLDGLLDVFQQHRHPWIFDRERASYV